MTFTSPSLPLEDMYHLNKAYGGCTCECHRNPNVFHVQPCCTPLRVSQPGQTPRLGSGKS